MSIDRKGAVVAAIEHGETSHCPYVFSWEGDIDRQLDAYYGSDQWRTRYRNYIQICIEACDGAFQEGRERAEDHYGSIWRTDRRPIHLEEPVLKSPSLRGYRFPSAERFFETDWQDRCAAKIREYEDCFTVGMLGFGLFERCWTLRGFENTLMDMACEPAFFEDLIESIADHQLELLDCILSLPIDGVLLGDDWGEQRGLIMGIHRWRELIKSSTERLYNRIKQSGKYLIHHSCGSVEEIIPDLIGMGLDVLESVQPEARGMDPYSLKDRFGNQLTFWGGLGSQSIVQFGKLLQIKNEIRNLVDYMGAGGGYILAGSKGIQPGTPVENAATVLEEFIRLDEPVEVYS